MGKVGVCQTDVNRIKDQTRDDCQVVALVERHKQEAYGRKCGHAEQDREIGEAKVVQHVEEVVRGQYGDGAIKDKRSQAMPKVFSSISIGNVSEFLAKGSAALASYLPLRRLMARGIVAP